MSQRKKQKTELPQVGNRINGVECPASSGKFLDVAQPATGEIIAHVGMSNADDVDKAVAAAEKAFVKWSGITVKSRVQVLLKLHALMRDNADELADIIVKEHGKTKQEALGDVNKGNETLEYACSMPQLIGGRVLEVSRGVECREYKRPLGVVASIVPFNFPAMVPFWTLPIAIATGNCIIVKPSEKVPLTMHRIMDFMAEAGLPAGVVQTVNGGVDAVNALCDHPKIKAVTFVGSSKVAEIVTKRCQSHGKPVMALGGAKNHLVALPDCNVDMTANDVVSSFCGCAGQRCMAASVLLTIGPNPKLMEAIISKAKALVPGSQPRNVGPVIDQQSLDRMTGYVANPQHEILLDGRDWKKEKGFWMGPTILKHTKIDDAAMQDEIFGPVLSVYECKDKEEAIAIENGNPYGNAACVYTSVGAHAQWFTQRLSAGMLGINIGVPVPREPFSFGGINRSNFGHSDITGDGGIEFFTQRIKVTQKWTPPPEGEASWMS